MRFTTDYAFASADAASDATPKVWKQQDDGALIVQLPDGWNAIRWPDGHGYEYEGGGAAQPATRELTPLGVRYLVIARGVLP